MLINQLQTEVNEWANRNFGTGHPSWHPLVGIIEEVGELSHCHLKMTQGIRGTKEQHTAGIIDALGDIVIYMCQYAALKHCTMQEVLGEHSVNKTLGELQQWVLKYYPVNEPHMYEWRCLLDIAATAGEAAKQHRPDFKSEGMVYDDKKWVCSALYDVLVAMCHYSNMMKIDLQQAVTEVWHEVGKRDWTKNKIDGVSK